MPNATAAPSRGNRLAIAAAALAWAPIGFVLGGFAAARALGPGATEGGPIAAAALLGAAAAAEQAFAQRPRHAACRIRRRRGAPLRDLRRRAWRAEPHGRLPVVRRVLRLGHAFVQQSAPRAR